MYVARSASHSAGKVDGTAVRCIAGLEDLQQGPDISHSNQLCRHSNLPGLCLECIPGACMPQRRESQAKNRVLAWHCLQGPLQMCHQHAASDATTCSTASPAVILCWPCRHCGATGMPHQFFAAGSKHCTGDCLADQPRQHYKQEYKAPC